MLLELQKYEELLSVQETEPLAQGILCPISEENLSLWWLFICAAAETGAADFIERHVPSVLAACGEKDEFSFLRSLLPFNQKARQEEKLKETKQRLLSLLPGMGMNPYFEETAKKEIESF